MNLSKGYLLVLVGIFALLSFMLVLPFLQYVLGAVLIAYILYPVQPRLESRTSPTIAALTLLVVAIAGFIVPFLVVVWMIAGDAAALAGDLEPEDLRLVEIEGMLSEEAGIEVDLAEELTSAGQDVGMIILGRTTELFSALTHLLVGLGLALFLVYYLLKQGGTFVGWIRKTTPLPEDVQDDLYGELDDVMRAVLLGHVLIALVQGVIAGLGLFATGIPNAAFWTFVMVILALIPLVGAFLVWGPAVGYLLLTGEPVFAAGLFLYSAVVVGISDDYLRPILVDRYADLSPAIIIVGVLGGIYAFGIMGLFFGPVVLGAFAATLSVVNDHYDRLEDDERATA